MLPQQVRDLFLQGRFKIPPQPWVNGPSAPTDAKLELVLKGLYQDGKDAINAGRLFYFETTENFLKSNASALNLKAGWPTNPPFTAPWVFILVTKQTSRRWAVFATQACLQGSKSYVADLMLIDDGNQAALTVYSVLIPEDGMLWCYHTKEALAQEMRAEDLRDRSVVLMHFVLNALHAPIEERPFEIVEPPPSFNRSRAKHGLPPMPGYQRINAERYVTFISKLRVPRFGPQGGTHASPTPHLRRGHYRTYRNGLRIFIQDTTVKVPLEQRENFLAERSHYQLRIANGGSTPDHPDRGSIGA